MTRSKLIRTTIVSLAGAAILGQPAIAGGEPKNQWPFTRPATIVVASSGSDGFDWTAGAIGAGAGLGLALAGTGAVLVARKSPLSA